MLLGLEQRVLELDQDVLLDLQNFLEGQLHLLVHDGLVDIVEAGHLDVREEVRSEVRHA